MNTCDIIGISDRRDQWFAPEVLEVVSAGHVFSGGKRHHEVMQQYLPEDNVWIDITVPLSAVFEQYAAHDHLVIFASGDPLFFGFASTVQRECPECRMRVFPTFNSLQMLAHKCLLPYQDMHVVSLTGRPWDKFDEAVINGEPLIGILTDRHNTPCAIAQRLLDYGYDNYRMLIGECLGNEEDERITDSMELKDVISSTFSMPNCLILQKVHERKRPFGIPESDFRLLNGRAKMITKMPIRLLSLSMMELRQKSSLWDVGFCTGSVSIEAKLQFPHLHITAFEVREEGRELMQLNSRRLGTPGIESHIGDFLEMELFNLTPPDAVFIGGHGGRLKEMVAKLNEVLLPRGVIVFNSVSEESLLLFHESIESQPGLSLVSDTLITVDSHNPIHILKAVKSL